MGNCVGGKSGKKDPKVLTEDEISLLLANTRLNRAQILALHHNFLKECPTGKLTKKEFVKLFKEVHPSENKKEKADKFCEYVFKVIDKDGLGYISFQDFVLCFSLTSDGDFKQKCEFAFRLYDLDKDGKISKKEMTQVLTALYDLSGITDRKGNKAPAKKVEEIIRKINATYQPPADGSHQQQQSTPANPKEAKKAAEKAAKEAKEREKKEQKEREKAEKERKAAEKKAKSASPAKEAKEAKKPAKPAKEPKQPKGKLPDHITKDQFIDACSSDEQLKRLFVDSIFSNSNADASANLHEAASINVVKPGVSSVKAGPITLHVESSGTPVKIEGEAPAIRIVNSTNSSSNGPVVDLGAGVKLVTHTTTVDLKDHSEPISVTTRTSTNLNNESSTAHSPSSTNNPPHHNNEKSHNNDSTLNSEVVGHNLESELENLAHQAGQALNNSTTVESHTVHHNEDGSSEVRHVTTKTVEIKTSSHAE